GSGISAGQERARGRPPHQTAVSRGLAARRLNSKIRARARSIPFLGHARLDQLSDQGLGQWLVRREMKRTPCLLVPAHPAAEGPERRPAERIIRAPLHRRAEPRDDHAIDSKGGKSVADALLGFGNDRVNRLPELLESPALLPADRREIVIDVCWLPGHH